MRIEPSSRLEAVIVVEPPKRGRHQEFWPAVEVRERTTVVAHESWGTRSATYEVVAHYPVDIRNGYTAEAIAEAKADAKARALKACAEIRKANPDYVDPARY